VSLLGYSLSGILRNRRRTFSSILGVLLAVTFIAGTFIAIDSSARATLDATLRSLQGDFNYYASPLNPPSPVAVSNGSVLRDAFATVAGVTDVSVYRNVYPAFGSLEIYKTSSPANQSYYFGSLMAIDPAHPPYSIRTGTVSGSLQLPNGTVVVDSQTASYLQARIGDKVTVVDHFYSYNGTYAANFTLPFTVSAIVTLATSSYPYGNYPTPLPGPYPGFSMVGLNLRDLPWVMSRLNMSDQYATQVQGEIWIDHARFINPYDISYTNFQLTRLSRALNQAMLSAGYNGNVNDNILYALEAYANLLTAQRLVYLLLSSPVILLGMYLGAVGVDLGHAERRRELGVLKTRGASPRQVALLLISESILGGLVATVLGLLFGIGLSRLLISVVTPFGGTADYAAWNLSVDTIVIVAILSILFMAIVSYRSARRTARLPIIETLRYYAPGETRIHYSPTLDIVMIGYSVFVYASYLYVNSTGQGNFFIMFIFILVALTLPITPILLIVGSVRLMTRSTARVYEWTSRLIRPFARNLEYVVGRNLSRNPRRSSNITVIIALGLAFGVFITSGLGSQQAIQEQSIRASIGADLAVSPYTANETTTPAFAANLSAVPGIAGVSQVRWVGASVSPSPLYNTASVYALDPSTYFAVSQPASFFYENPGNQQAAQQILATPGQVLITGQFAKDGALQIGDSLFLSITSYTANGSRVESTTVQVGGLVRFLPGTFGGSFFGSISAPDAVYGSFTTLSKLTAAEDNSSYRTYGSVRFLASLKPGADWRAVKENVTNLGSATVQVYQEQLDQINNNPFTGSFLGFIRMEIAFIVVILTAGLALIMYAASLERTVEFAGIMARGSSGWQTAGLLVGEATSIMLIGVIMGLAVGLFTGYLYATFTTAGIMGSAEPIVPNLFVFPLDGFLLVILAPLAMIGTTVLVAWRIARMNVARALKMRGG
jgi:putative ABC transport system permease protein